ncbi:MAG: choice-of-anchor tandem repeat GloVer-containing protein, partial [Methylocella sp.]
MQCNNSNRSRAFWARGFAALWAVLMVAAGGGALAAPAEAVLHSFTGGSDGSGPVGGLIADSSGNLYGTTEGGGASDSGTVFKLTPGGTETVLYSFCSVPSCSDGRFPSAGLIAGSNGNLFGTTAAGGASDFGTVFKVTPGGTETVLYSFTGGGDGGVPEAGLIADSSVNLYGTTYAGGASFSGFCGGGGCGVVFKLSPGGTYTVLYRFTGGNDGGTPFAGLIADTSGNLYGTASSGGASNDGVVFKLTPGGTETVLYSFKAGPSDGAFPLAGLIADSSGNLYGTTESGGTGCIAEFGCGTVFKLSPGGTETVLYSFKASPSDGAQPFAGLYADSSGNLYGTTSGGGASRWGTVFKLSPGGTETVYSFTGGSNGGQPVAGLIADSSGNLYGTTEFGGGSGCRGSGCGVVFKLTGTGFVPPPAYVTNTGSNTVSVLDTVTNTVAATVTVGVNPKGVAVTPDGQHAYVTNLSGGTVSVLATPTNTVAATVPVGLKPKGVAVTPNGTHAYVTNSGSGTVSVIKTSTNTVVATVGVGTTPFGVAVTPEGTHAYVANKGSNTVSVIATASKAVAATVTVGLKPEEVAITPDGKRAYVTNSGSNNVSVINTAANTVVKTVTVGLKPSGIAITADGTQAYVANSSDGTVSVIDTSTKTVVATIPVGTLPLGVAFSLDGKHA